MSEPQESDLATIAYLSGAADGRRDAEREIVAWLKAQDRSHDNHALCIAVRIEAGEHRKGSGHG